MATIWDNITLFMTVWGILCVYSYTFKDNPFWKWATNTLVGGYIAYSAISNIDYMNKNVIIPMMTKVNWVHVAAILVGLLWYFRFWRKYYYLYRYALAISVGSGIGISLAKTVRSNLIQQITSTMLPLYGTGTLRGDFDNIVIVVSVFSVMTYFLFTIVHEGPVGKPIGWISKVGRWFLIVTFGVQFGNVIASRMSLFIGTVSTLMLPKHQTIFAIIGPIILIYLVGTELAERRKVVPEIPAP